jgi:hypothetical protein
MLTDHLIDASCQAERHPVTFDAVPEEFLAAFLLDAAIYRLVVQHDIRLRPRDGEERDAD